MNGPRKLLAAALAYLSLATAAHAHAGWNTQIREVDAQFRRAMIKGDVAALDRLVANDARIIHGGHGSIQDKKGLIDRFRAYHIDSYDRTPVLTKVGGTLAVLVSVTRKVADGKETDTSTTEVFVRRFGRWQILVLQNTDHTGD